MGTCCTTDRKNPCIGTIEKSMHRNVWAGGIDHHQKHVWHAADRRTDPDRRARSDFRLLPRDRKQFLFFAQCESVLMRSNNKRGAHAKAQSFSAHLSIISYFSQSPIISSSAGQPLEHPQPSHRARCVSTPNQRSVHHISLRSSQLLRSLCQTLTHTPSQRRPVRTRVHLQVSCGCSLPCVCRCHHNASPSELATSELLHGGLHHRDEVALAERPVHPKIDLAIVRLLEGEDEAREHDVHHLARRLSKPGRRSGEDVRRGGQERSVEKGRARRPGRRS